MTPWRRWRWRSITAFWLCLAMMVMLLGTVECHKVKRKMQPSCGGTLTARTGVIQTPNFPGRFPVPIRCQWVIDASIIPSNNGTIVVYLTQLFVLKGLKFIEYAHYGPGTKYGERLIYTVSEKNMSEVRWLQPLTPFLVIDFDMQELEGNHLRALYGLLDVYGFNITYEISTSAQPIRTKTCSVVECSYVGHCYAAQDLSNFWCSCFDGYSNANCSHGPLCEEGRTICQNGASCRHLGANAVVCDCPDGFTGYNCGIQKPTVLEKVEGCGEYGCLSQCSFDGRPENVCNCPKGPRIPTDRARFEGTVRLANFPTGRDVTDVTVSRLVGLIERQLQKYLKNSSLIKIEDLRILNITNAGEMTFHFFGANKDSSRVHEALNSLVKRGRLGNLTLYTTLFTFRQDPTLLLQSVKVNQDSAIKEGDEFIISCIAQGSSYMTFQWYKDGIFVNTSKASRRIWTHLNPLDTQDQYTARLGIAHATSLDDGVYTCQVEDWGIQQCKSVQIEVRVPPIVNVIPRSVTVQKGDNTSIVCISPNDRPPDNFGYNWSKNSKLFPVTAGVEVWEDLYPAGSILKITNVQKSAKYTCRVNGYVTTEVNVRVEVLNKTIVPLCPEQEFLGITWSETSPGVYCIQDCPPRFAGTVERLCTLRDLNQPEWDPPNFSSCFAEPLLSVHNNFLRLTYGYQNTTATETMVEYLRYLETRTSLYPGEGERLIVLVQEVLDYVNITESHDEVHNVTRIMYKIVDCLLKHKESIIDGSRVAQLERLVRNQAMLTASLLRLSGDLHQNLDTFAVDIANLGSTTYNFHIPLGRNSYPYWFADKLDLHMGNANGEPFGNGSFTVAVIAYKNLSSFLPARGVAQMRNGNDLQYEIISKLLSVSLGRKRGRPLPVPPGTMWLNLELHHAANNYSWEAWNTTCAVADVASAGSGSGYIAHWDMESCATLTLNATLTRCTCSRTGTFAILLITKPSMALTVAHQYQLVILLGCVCCLVQALVALGVLLLYWWYHRSCLVYLKVQCCAATIGAMAVFLYALCNKIPYDSYAYITTCLETFLLIGMSSHLSKLLIVFTELVQMTRVRSLKPTVVGIITGVPVIAIFGNHLAHRSIGRQLDSWWLLWGTMSFNIFVISSAVLFILFVFLYFSVMRKLHLLVTKHLTNNKALHKRIGLLRRSALIFLTMVIMVVASILYINIIDVSCNYVFSASCALLGFLQLMCYVIKCENSMRAHLAKKLKLHGNDEDFSSDSANSPLSFFTKQDPDAESESAPPRQNRAKGVGRIDSSEGLLLSNSQRKFKYPSSEGAPSTIETYLHSISEDSVERYESEAHPDGKEDVDLELYNSSPKKYRQSPIDAALYSESEKMYPEHWFLRTHPEQVIISPTTGKFLRDMPHPPDILTTRVCVELGLVPASNPSVEANILVEAPSILLCNVEVEPCDALDIPTTTIISAEPIPSASAQIVPILRRSSTTTTTTAKCKATIDEAENENSSETSETSSERKQPEGREKVCLISENEDDDNLDGMLDRISHDLDYLLNRTIPEIQITPATLPLHGRKTSKLPASSVRGQIKEEEEPDQDEETNNEKLDESDSDIAKTAC